MKQAKPAETRKVKTTKRCSGYYRTNTIADYGDDIDTRIEITRSMDEPNKWNIDGLGIRYMDTKKDCIDFLQGMLDYNNGDYEDTQYKIKIKYI